MSIHSTWGKLVIGMYVDVPNIECTAATCKLATLATIHCDQSEWRQRYAAFMRVNDALKHEALNVVATFTVIERADRYDLERAEFKLAHGAID